MIAKIIGYVKQNQHKLFIVACMGLIGFIGYNLGLATAVPKGQIKVTGDANIYSATASTIKETPTPTPTITPKPTPRPTPKPIDPRVVASKNSKKYHYLLCPGVSRIAEQNKIYFASAQEAESRGYTLAGNCKK